MYIPRQGDIIFMTFNPQSGHEQGGRRPALVVSNDRYNQLTNLAMVCPITNTGSGFPLHVPLAPPAKTTGFVMCEQVKALDMEARGAEYAETAPDDLLGEVLERLFLSLE